MNALDDVPASPARRALLGGAAAFALLQAAGTARAASAATAVPTLARRFPKGFAWGTATAGHQVEGNNVASDLWFLEHLPDTVFAEPSGDAVNSLELWATDLDLVRSIGLDTYRFSLEWARIEPEPGQFSVAMLDHYLRIIEGCRARGLRPMVTFNHFTTPRWFAARGGWTHEQSPALFARYCERAARHLAAPIEWATTLNEPQLLRLLRWGNLLPPFVWDRQVATLALAARTLGVPKYSSANVADPADLDALQANLLRGHRLGREAIKAERPALPVGASLAVVDDQAVGEHSRRDEKRAWVYGEWLEAVRGDDFVGVQNYERAVIDEHGVRPPPAGAPRNAMGSEVYPASLANAVRYVHEATGRPVFVTEHGIGTEDDAQRAAFIPAALGHLADATDAGVPVLGYVHWTLLDNFEWIFGYKAKYGLCSVDRTDFRRTPKPSASVLGAIARAQGRA